VYIGHYGFGFGIGYPGFGFAYPAPWDYGYYDGGYAPTFYGDTVYYRPTEVEEAGKRTQHAVAKSDGDGEWYLVRAERAFRDGRYEESVGRIRHALVENPDDGRALLFLSQSLFAVGDYRGAITTAYRGMSVSDREEWGYVVQNYADYYRGKDYVTQMDRLNTYIAARPDAAYAWALRGYHYGYLGYEEQARRDLAKALELESRDRWAGKLIAEFGGERELPESKTTPEAAPGEGIPPQRPLETLPAGPPSD
jgi:tetratricopeptide (TPR) repeat protein